MKCKDKSCCPGVRLIPSSKLQTHTLKNFLEKNPEKPETNIQRTHNEQRCYSMTLNSLCWSQGPYQIPGVKTAASGYCIFLHFMTEPL